MTLPWAAGGPAGSRPPEADIKRLPARLPASLTGAFPPAPAVTPPAALGFKPSSRGLGAASSWGPAPQPRRQPSRREGQRLTPRLALEETGQLCSVPVQRPGHGPSLPRQPDQGFTLPAAAFSVPLPCFRNGDAGASGFARPGGMETDSICLGLCEASEACRPVARLAHPPHQPRSTTTPKGPGQAPGVGALAWLLPGWGLRWSSAQKSSFHGSWADAFNPQIAPGAEVAAAGVFLEPAGPCGTGAGPGLAGVSARSWVQSLPAAGGPVRVSAGAGACALLPS